MTDHLSFTASLVVAADSIPAAAPHRGPDRLGLHLLFALGCLLLFAAAVGGMRRAWYRRTERQEEDFPGLPAVPAETGMVLAAPLKGLYLGTVDAGHWLDRITARGLGGRADAYVTVYERGIQVDRTGSDPFWIPRQAVRGARLERAHAGKVAGAGRIIVLAWSFGGHELETGLRGEDRARQPKVVRAVHGLIGPAPGPTDGEITRPRPVGRAVSRLRPRAGDPAPETIRPGRPGPAASGPATGPGAIRPAGTSPIPVVTRAPRTADPAGPQPGPAGTGPDSAGQQPAPVDPLTSPLRDVVRKMKSQR
jgi:carbamoyl-phosphate synthase small subunit